MFAKLFGPTEQDQLQYLHVRSLATIAIFVIIAVALILNAVGLSGGASTLGGIAEMGFAVIMLFVWGWPCLTKFFGITSVAAIFSNNVIIGLLLFLLLLFGSYFAGIIFAVIGVVRYIQLRIKYGKNNQ